MMCNRHESGLIGSEASKATRGSLPSETETLVCQSSEEKLIHCDLKSRPVWTQKTIAISVGLWLVYVTVAAPGTTFSLTIPAASSCREVRTRLGSGSGGTDWRSRSESGCSGLTFGGVRDGNHSRASPGQSQTEPTTEGTAAL